MAKIYALYKGDEYIADGTLEEIAEKTGKKPASLKWMLTPAAKKRAGAGSSVLVCIGEEIYVKKCVICGKAFRAKLPPNKKYCSVSCRQKAQKLKDKKMAFPNLPESERERKCASCGKVFVANRSDQRYCSKRCSSNGGGYRGTMLKLPPKKRRYESHIERSTQERVHSTRAMGSCKRRSCWQDCTRR